MTTPSTTTAGERPARREHLPPMGRAWLLPLYDPFSRLVGAERLHRRLLDQAALRPGERVLEIGCGTGNLLLLAHGVAPGVVTTGLDPDAAALARAARKARRRGTDVRLDLGYADALPYPDASVDVVLSSLMSESTAFGVGSMMSMSRLCVRISKCSRLSLYLWGDRMTQKTFFSVGSGTGPTTDAPARVTVSTILRAELSMTSWS